MTKPNNKRLCYKWQKRICLDQSQTTPVKFFLKGCKEQPYSYSPLVTTSQNYTLEEIICWDILRIIPPGDGTQVCVLAQSPVCLKETFCNPNHNKCTLNSLLQILPIISIITDISFFLTSPATPTRSEATLTQGCCSVLSWLSECHELQTWCRGNNYNYQKAKPQTSSHSMPDSSHTQHG